MDKFLIDFLKELKHYGEINDIPNISERGGRFLNLLVKISKAKNVLEVGCANGYSTIWLADAVVDNDGKVTTFDFSKPSIDAARYNVGDVGLLPYVDFHFGDFLKIFKKITKPKTFDFVFVDGQKREYWDFWRLIKPRLSPRAIVVFDDVLEFPEKTDTFMHQIVKEHDFAHLVLPVDFKDGVLILFKKD
jgi:predicted O-methyltransferase YrrM